MADPRVSVIIPAYNAARTLRQAVESVLAQTYRSFEVVVVDDGSTDGTAATLAGMPEAVKCFRQDNAERSIARNNAISHARGEILAFLDADDYWAPRKLERQMALLDANPKLDVVFSYAAAFDPANGRTLRVLGTDFTPRNGLGFDAFEDLALRTSLPALTVVARAARVAEAGFFDRDICDIEDWDLWLRLAVRCTMDLVPEVLAYYRLSGSFKPQRWADKGVPENRVRVLARALELARSVRAEPPTPELVSRALAATHIRAALIYAAADQPQSATESMRHAHQCSPELFTRDVDRLAYAIVDFALNIFDTWTPPHAATSFLDSLFGDWPIDLGNLKELERTVRRTVAAGHGFRAWAQGEPALARSCLVHALLKYPEVGRNRGLWSICMRSTLGLRPPDPLNGLMGSD